MDNIHGQVRKVVLVGLISALCVVTNYALLPFPNIKLMDTVVFLSGFLFGLPSGISVAAIPWFIYGTLNPYGLPPFPTFLSVILGEMIYAFTGYIVSRRPDAFHGRTWLSIQNIGFGVVGMVSTLLYDLLTNAVTGWIFYGSVFIGLLTMNFPLPLGIIHEVSNFFLFALLAPPIIHTVRRRDLINVQG